MKKIEIEIPDGKRAEYATKQFRDIYADFCGCEKGGDA